MLLVLLLALYTKNLALPGMLPPPYPLYPATATLCARKGWAWSRASPGPSSSRPS